MATMFRERGFWTTLGSLLGVVLVVQLLVLSLAGIDVADQVLRKNAALQVDIQEGATDNAIQQLYGAFQELPYVSSVTYVTRDKAYEHARAENPELISFIEKAQLSNPFPDSVVVSLRSMDDTSAFLSFAQSAQWSKIVDPASLSRAGDRETEMRDMQRLLMIGFALVLGFFVFVIFVLLFVLIDLVRRRCLARKEEVLVERLSGAVDLAILLPFAVEGTLLLLGAVLCSALLLCGLLYALYFRFPQPSLLLSADIQSALFPILTLSLPIVLAAELVFSPLLAFIGAWIGLRPLLKKNLLAH